MLTGQRRRAAVECRQKAATHQQRGHDTPAHPDHTPDGIVLTDEFFAWLASMQSR